MLTDILQSDQFQDDLYPDTAAPIPAVSAADWFNGVNRPPVLMSMKTGKSSYFVLEELN